MRKTPDIDILMCTHEWSCARVHMHREEGGRYSEESEKKESKLGILAFMTNPSKLFAQSGTAPTSRYGEWGDTIHSTNQVLSDPASQQGQQGRPTRPHVSLSLSKSEQTKSGSSDMEKCGRLPRRTARSGNMMSDGGDNACGSQRVSIPYPCLVPNLEESIDING